MIKNLYIRNAIKTSHPNTGYFTKLTGSPYKVCCVEGAVVICWAFWGSSPKRVHAVTTNFLKEKSA